MMPGSSLANPSRKRQRPEQYTYNTHRSKNPKPNEKSASAYWDNLSKVWLTKAALRELDWRNSTRPPQNHRPATRQFSAVLKKLHEPSQFAPEFLYNCSNAKLTQIRRFARLGGPDLSDLRGYPEPQNLLQPPMSSCHPRRRKRRAESPPPAATNTKSTTKATNATAYSCNFEQNLIDHKVYPVGYKYFDGQRPAKPKNWDEINARLAQRRASLSPSNFSERAFDKFSDEDANASKENPVAISVIPIVAGNNGDPKCVGRGHRFVNLAHLTDGTLAKAKPDHFYGARPEQLNRKIRKELSNHIIPSTQDSLPMLPNFFLEAKGPDGTPAVATRQACYDGALGARAMHALQSYQQDGSIYDSNAYTLTSTYFSGVLKLYTTHLTPPTRPGDRPEYVMTQLRSFCLTDTYDAFCEGAAAYRNARDWAKEQRDKCIGLANERYSKSQARNRTDSEGPTTSDDSDVSTVLGESQGSKDIVTPTNDKA